MRLDATDQRIIACLVEDGRRSFADVGEVVNLSAPAVKRRVDKLRADGVVRGFTAVVDPKALGWRVEGFVELFCEGRIPPDAIRAMLADIPEVQSAFTVTGEADAMIMIRASDMGHFEQVLETVRERALVTKTRSSVVLSRL